MKKAIHTPNAPAAIGPYSQAVWGGDTLYISGQIPLVPATGEFAGTTIEAQTEQALNNIKAILESQGMDMSNIVKTSVLLQDIGDFAAMNGVYAKFFGEEPPARAAFQVAALPKGALVEIEAIAVRK